MFSLFEHNEYYQILKDKEFVKESYKTYCYYGNENDIKSIGFKLSVKGDENDKIFFDIYTDYGGVSFFKMQLRINEFKINYDCYQSDIINDLSNYKICDPLIEILYNYIQSKNVNRVKSARK